MTEQASAEARAAAYAATLGAHAEHDAAERTLGALGEAQERARQYANNRREQQELLDQTIHDLATIERGKYSDLSVAAFERHMKSVVQDDPECYKLREQIRHLHHLHDTAADEVEQAKLSIKISTARMNELGGLFNFFAAVKSKS
jgi:hypothetical protein